ncbi:hypothetical protein [Agrococcus citreus]|uniref:Uncharacterized protein n=1 Tax=Agrococcus citreus TaxID=84643 RepID=A0ABN1YST6_9MICO
MTDHDPWAKVRTEQAPEPVALLQKLGLATDMPAWWRAPTAGGEPGTYILNPKFLSPHDIQQLAALTLGGYWIKTFPRRDRIRIVLSKEQP